MDDRRSSELYIESISRIVAVPVKSFPEMATSIYVQYFAHTYVIIGVNRAASMIPSVYVTSNS